MLLFGYNDACHNTQSGNYDKNIVYGFTIMDTSSI